MKTDRQKVAELMSELGVKVDTAIPESNDIIIDARIGNVWFAFDENDKFKSIATDA